MLAPKVNIGPTFIEQVNRMLEKMREHYKGRTKYNKDGKKGGGPKASSQFVEHTRSQLAPPKAATVAVLG